MKKNYLWTILAGVALASCVSNDEVEQSVLQKQELTFGNPVLNSQTRDVAGEISGTTYPKGENFIVWAVETNGEFVGWGAGNVEDAFFFTEEGVVVSSPSNSTYWHITGSEKYYWPAEESHRLTFAACSPARIKSHAGTVSYGATGLVITDFLMPTNPALHFDLMYSDRTIGVNKSPVTISFRHALASLVIYAEKPTLDTGGAYSVKIKKIILKGDIYNKGTFTNTYGEESTSSVGSTNWTTSNTDPNITYELFNDTYEVSTDLEKIPTLPFLVIPQTVDSDMKISITYQITQQENNTPVEFTKDFPFTDFKTTNQSHTSTWEAGNRYRYVINFGAMKEITFSPVISADWKETDAGAIEISTSALGGVVAP